MKQDHLPVLLIDGNNLLYRAAYGFPTKIFNRRKEDITTVFAFFALLRIAFLEVGYPLFPIVCFDGEHCLDEKRILLSSYKLNRIHNRQNPYADLPAILSSLDKIGISVVVQDYLEADEVIAHIAHTQLDLSPSYIMSSDKDFYQLLNEYTFILNTMKKSGERIITSEHVFDKFGVMPSQWVYFRALMGDPSDFIKGVMGVGPKTAVSLLQLPEAEMQSILYTKYGVSWDEYQNMVSVIQLGDLKDRALFTYDKRMIEAFDTPARIIDSLGLWG